MLVSIDTSVRIWNLNSQNEQFCEFQFQNPLSVKFHPNSRQILVSGKSEYLSLFDLNQSPPKLIKTDSNINTMIAVSKNGAHFAVGDVTGTVSIFDFNPLKKNSFHSHHRSPITALSFTNDSSAILTGDSIGKLSRGSYATPTLLPKWSSRKFGPINDFFEQRDELAIASGESVKIYDLNRNTFKIDFQPGYVSTIRFSPFKNDTLILGLQSGQLQVYDLRSNLVTQNFKFTTSVKSLDIKADGNIVAAAVKDLGIYLLDLRLFEPTLISDQETTMVAFQPKDIVLVRNSDKSLSRAPKNEAAEEIIKKYTQKKEDPVDAEKIRSRFSISENKSPCTLR